VNNVRAAILLLFIFQFVGIVWSQTAKPAARPGQHLKRFLAVEWDYWMREYPEKATGVGYPGQNARWTDYSPVAIERHKEHLHKSLAQLRAMDIARLTTKDRLNYNLYRNQIETTIEGLRFGNDAMPLPGVVASNLLMPINQMSGVQQGVAEVLAITPARNAADYEDILARLDGVPALVDQTMALLREGLRRGWTPPRITLRDVPKQIEGLLSEDPLASPLLRPFQKLPATIPEADRTRLIARATAAYRDKVAPAFRKLRDYLMETYIPGCRENIASSALPAAPASGQPDGAKLYAYNVRWHTTTNLSPQQIHEMGLSEVRRIRAEMDKVIASAGFQGSFEEFTHFLRTDPRFYFTEANALVESYRDIAKRADPELAHLFATLPRLPYGVKVIPEHAAPSQTTAYYEPGSLVAGRPGWYFVNTYNLAARPKWEMEALSLHEAVPGHHLQIALAQELADLPEFRKRSGYTAFVEGWALYAESLGDEMEFYRDPYSKFGQLTYEMWRAIRLVVDTGMHSMGWSRQQALDYFRANSAKTDQDITVEVDRYIVWPGQALGYKIGQLKIRELRAAAEKELGPNFNLRSFHDAVLLQGALPLDLLEARMRAWVARGAKGRSGSD